MGVINVLDACRPFRRGFAQERGQMLVLPGNDFAVDHLESNLVSMVGTPNAS